MEFNKSRTMQMGIISIAIVITAIVIIARLDHHKVDLGQEPLPADHLNDPSGIAQEVDQLKPTAMDENDAVIKKMTEEMEKDRQKQRRIKDLQMQKEETDLELDEQKSLLELNKIKKDSTGLVNDGNAANTSNLDIKIEYLGGTDIQRQAILSINGINYSVKDKDRPLENVEVLKITNSDVTIHFLSPENKISTYQFKPE